jgi:drug/metabolite transporter (DMT)-like permease
MAAEQVFDYVQVVTGSTAAIPLLHGQQPDDRMSPEPVRDLTVAAPFWLNACQRIDQHRLTIGAGAMVCAFAGLMMTALAITNDSMQVETGVGAGFAFAFALMGSMLALKKAVRETIEDCFIERPSVIAVAISLP